MKWWTPSRVNELCRRIDAGDSIELIARDLGRTVASCKMKLHSMRDERLSQMKWMPKQLDEFSARYASGETFDAIVAAMGVSESVLKRMRKHLDLPLRQTQQPTAKNSPKKRVFDIRFEDASRQELRADIARRQMAYFRMPDETRITLKRFIVPWTLP